MSAWLTTWSSQIQFVLIMVLGQVVTAWQIIAIIANVTIIDNYHLQDVLSQIRQLDYLLSKAQDIKIADR